MTLNYGQDWLSLPRCHQPLPPCLHRRVEVGRDPARVEAGDRTLIGAVALLLHGDLLGPLPDRSRTREKQVAGVEEGPTRASGRGGRLKEITGQQNLLGFAVTEQDWAFAGKHHTNTYALSGHPRTQPVVVIGRAVQP